MAIDQPNLNVVVLAGGVGGAKLAHGLAQILPPERLTVIVNTGDDFWLYGLRICPDLDTVMYTLGGVVDPVNGWGRAGDSFDTLSALQRYGEASWFRVGDLDMATHLVRTHAILNGETLTSVTRRLSAALGIQSAILPMADAQVATKIATVEQGELDFQVYFVRERWQPTVRAIRYDGIEGTAVSPEVRAAITNANVILIGPSNPWLSIAPILAVPGLRDLLTARSIPRVALSPIVGGKAIKGPAAKLMAELRLEVSARTVAGYYGGLINGFVYDERDQGLNVEGLRTATFDTIMKDEGDRAVLARKILEWIQGWEGSHERLGDHTSQTTEPG